MQRASKLLAFALLLSGCRPAERQVASVVDRYPEDWVVNPKVPGPDVPPAGQSLFDTIVARPVPFPFTKLLEYMESRLGGHAQVRRVLIPLGRSLQRTAASPDFFEYPRAVVAFDSELVKDRLFMGYQEKAGVIEVLSYNGAAGRFEFQLVNNYREGATPDVQFGKRAICTTCHQNQAPIFPRPLWDETNSNSRISRMLVSQQRSFYDFPKEQSADVPYEIDNSVHRANEFSTYQLLWTQADAPVRAAWLRAMLTCRLSGACEFDTTQFEEQMARWRAKWPRGLKIPNPEIPNRNPLASFSREAPRDQAEMVALLADRQKNIDPRFEPATPREPLETWQITPERLQRVMAGLATFFPINAIREIDHALLAKPAEVVQYRTKCVATSGMELHCAGGDFSMDAGLSMRGGKPTGEIRRLVVGTQPAIRNLIITGGRVARDIGETARCADGNRIERFELNGAEGVLVVRRDFQFLAAAIDRLQGQTDAFASKPFRPSVLRELLLSQINF